MNANNRALFVLRLLTYFVNARQIADKYLGLSLTHQSHKAGAATSMDAPECMLGDFRPPNLHVVPQVILWTAFYSSPACMHPPKSVGRIGFYTPVGFRVVFR